LGFVAFGHKNVVINLPDSPRSAAETIECALDADGGAGRITLADGLRLYVSSGAGLARHDEASSTWATPCSFIDIDLYRTDRDGEHLIARKRLWAERDLRMTKMIMPRDAGPATAAAAVPNTVDIGLVAAAGDEPALRSAAETLTRVATAGGKPSEMIAAYERIIATERWKVLRRLIEARNSDAQRSRELIDEARRSQQRLSDFSDAFTRWRARYASTDGAS